MWGFEENNKIKFPKPQDIHEIYVSVGLLDLRGALNQSLYSVNDLFYYGPSRSIFAATVNYMKFHCLCQMVQFDDKDTTFEHLCMDCFIAMTKVLKFQYQLCNISYSNGISYH